MKAITVAALLIQLTAAGGAGPSGTRAGKGSASPRASRGEDVGQQLSTLKNEISSLKDEFRAARERQRQDAERKKHEDEERYGDVPATPASPRAAAGAGGAGAPAR